VGISDSLIEVPPEHLAGAVTHLEMTEIGSGRPRASGVCADHAALQIPAVWNTFSTAKLICRK